MIPKIPGWLNFILLTAFYYGIFTLLDLLFNLGIMSKSRLIITMFYAGGYLSKWRWQGGGWSFK